MAGVLRAPSGLYPLSLSPGDLVIPLSLNPIDALITPNLTSPCQAPWVSFWNVQNQVWWRPHPAMPRMPPDLTHLHSSFDFLQISVNLHLTFSDQRCLHVTSSCSFPSQHFFIPYSVIHFLFTWLLLVVLSRILAPGGDHVSRFLFWAQSHAKCLTKSRCSAIPDEQMKGCPEQVT